MSKGLRVFLRIFQILSLLGALLYLTLSFLWAYADLGALVEEEHMMGSWIIGLGILSIAFSPTLWSLHRGGSGPASAASQPTGAYNRIPEPPQASPQPPQPAGAGYDSMGPGPAAPAPPASSYGQPSGPGFGAQPSGGPSPASPPQQQGESPWGSK